jgi:hypothetical protein
MTGGRTAAFPVERLPILLFLKIEFLFHSGVMALSTRN